jgi:DNA invertase Pin-like site-specific DNA recombinase
MPTAEETGMALIGYARVSTVGQDLALQMDALEAAGCDRIFTEKASGTKSDRPELEATLAYMRDGDTLVVWKLDRLGRSVRHLVNTVIDLEERGIGFRSLTQGIDTTTPAGRLVFNIFAALAEFERELTIERTMAGLAAARARGRIGGRRSVITPDKLKVARQMINDGESVTTAARTISVSRATLYRHLS